MEIKNAIIESASLYINDRGLLTCLVVLDYGGSGQGFVGHALYLPKSFSNHELKSFAGHFLFRVMQVAGVSEWDLLAGNTVRVKIENGIISAIGHIINDDWFEPKTEFN